MSTHNIKAIIFDCFGVLYVDPSLAFYETYTRNSDSARHALMDIDRQFDSGHITMQEHDQQVAELVGLSYDEVSQGIRGNHTRNQTLISILLKLREQYKIGMLSNIGKGGMESYFPSSEWDEYFSEVVLSSDVGITKPDPEIFRIMAKRLGYAEQECLMIDDRQDNCDGARSAGMESILYTTNHELLTNLLKLGITTD